MDLSKAFFQLQLSFVEKVTQKTRLAFEEALLSYTTFYLHFDLGRTFDPANCVWQEYLKGLTLTNDPAEWTYTFYQRRRAILIADFYGCFYYSFLPAEQTIRIHFIDREISGYGSLSKERVYARLQELQSMFRDIRSKIPEARMVRGGSWLYNLDAYKRLFPSEYVRTARIIDDEFQFLSLWGQFLRRDGQLRDQLAASFLVCIQKQYTLNGLKQCFPYQVLRPECALDPFYKLYETMH